MRQSHSLRALSGILDQGGYIRRVVGVAHCRIGGELRRSTADYLFVYTANHTMMGTIDTSALAQLRDVGLKPDGRYVRLEPERKDADAVLGMAA